MKETKLNSLLRPSYQVIKPIPISYQQYEDEVLIFCTECPSICFSGDDEADALENIKGWIEDSYDSLMAEPVDRLGTEMLRQRNYLYRCVRMIDQ